MAVSRDYVIAAFLQHLGRAPESEEAIASHVALGTEAKVTSVLTRSKEFFRHKFKNISFDLSARDKILIIGNCQVGVIAKLIEAMSAYTSVVSIVMESATLEGMRSGNLDLGKYVSECDYIVVQGQYNSVISELASKFPEAAGKQRLIPAISYTAYHPDMGYIVRADGSHFSGATGDYHSLLCFWAWQKGYSAQEAITLFNYQNFDTLGYFSHKAAADKFLTDLGAGMEIDMRPFLRQWAAKGCFMHSLNHPKLYVMADIARYVLSRERIAYAPSIETYVADDLANHPCWDVFPAIASKFNIEGSYSFKQPRHMGTASRPAPILSLTQFVELSYKHYEANRHAGLRFLVESTAFSKLEASLGDRAKVVDSLNLREEKIGGNPYLKLKSYQLWRRGIESAEVRKVDPVVASTLTLTPMSKVATAGSCFAQHISRTLSNNGFTYFVAERGDESAHKDDLEKLNYGVYSARYGNLYTSRQLIQLFERAYGEFMPLDDAWRRKDGRYVDPFRPMINPDGYATRDEVGKDRDEHFRNVRNMFESLDVFVFTLGLTESWRRREDGAVFPLAPGVAGGGMDSAIYEFVNFETHDVIADLEYFLDRLSQVNPAARVIFTVSPVPLVATYEDRHVLSSTTYSKSALRSAADYIVRRYPQAEYFPSYEIITGNYNKGAYFESDLRSVREEGVAHVMRLFMKHYSAQSALEVLVKPITEPDAELLRAAAKNNSVVCEEEVLDPGSV
jgi:hypothetical protein